MKTATVQYKCRMCGEVFRGGTTGSVSLQLYILEALRYGYSSCNNSIPLTTTSLHRHKSDSVGIGDIIGYIADE